jgi:hypothetical protein
MKRWIAGLLVVGVVALLVAATPGDALARGRHYHHGHGHGGYFLGGLAVGALTGLIVGSIAAAPPVYAAPPPVVYQPAPVYVAPQPVYVAPQPVYIAPACTDVWVEGRWSGPAWIGPHWERICR